MKGLFKTDLLFKSDVGYIVGFCWMWPALFQEFLIQNHVSWWALLPVIFIVVKVSEWADLRRREPGFVNRFIRASTEVLFFAFVIMCVIVLSLLAYWGFPEWESNTEDALNAGSSVAAFLVMIMIPVWMRCRKGAGDHSHTQSDAGK